MAKRFSLILSKILNIGPSEAPHVAVSWVMGFLSRVAFVVGWTVLVVYSITQFGIASLPLVFIAHGFVMLIGPILFSEIIERVEKAHILIAISIVGAIIAGLSAYFMDSSEWIFMGGIFVILSLLLTQFKIVHKLFAEELFTPTQSTRVFPIIESAETFGIIIGGLLISVLSTVIPMSKFLYILMFTLLLIVPAVLSYLSHSISVPFNDLKPHEFEKKSRLARLAEVPKASMKIPFLKSLIVIIFLQWTFFSVLEFQYTKAVEHYVSHGEEHVAEDGHQVAYGPSLEEDIIVDGKKYERDLATDLGLLQVLFGVATFLFQILLASRFLALLGVVGSMLISPIALIISVGWMTINFGIGTAILARFNHEISHVLFNNSYHSSFYALPHRIRGSVMEFLEGFVRPLGLIVGTTGLILVTQLIAESDQTLFLNIFGLSILGLILFKTIRLKKYYVKMPRNDLANSESINTMINAVDVIRQNRHEDDADFLVDYFNSNDDLHFDVKSQIVRSFYDIGSPKHLSFLIQVARGDSALCADSLYSIGNIFKKYSKEVMAMPFTWHGLKSLYSDLLSESSDPNIRAELVSLIMLSHYHDGLFDKVIETIDMNMNDDYVHELAMVLDGINDHHLVSIVSNYIDHESPRVKSAVISTVWSYQKDESIILKIEDMLKSYDNVDCLIEALILILKLNQSERFDSMIHEVALVSGDTRVQFLARVHFYLIGSKQPLIKFLFDEISFEDLDQINGLVSRINNPHISRMFRKRVISDIHESYLGLTEEVKDSNTESLRQHFLFKIRDLYKILGASKEYFVIEEILRSESY